MRGQYAVIEVLILTGLAARQLVAILSEEGKGWPGPFGVCDWWRALLWRVKLKGPRLASEVAHGLLCPLCAGFYYSAALLVLWLVSAVVWQGVSTVLAAWSITLLFKPEQPPDDTP